MALLLSSLPQQSITSVPRAPSSLTLIGLSVLLLLMTRATAATASMGVNSLLMGFQMSASVVVDKIASAHLHQKASSTILGIAAPAITRTGDPKRPFGVDNNTFPDFPSARQRSCADQFNICQLMANTNKTVDFTLPDCENQQKRCLKANQAVVAASSSTSSSSLTSTSTSTSESTTSESTTSESTTSESTTSESTTTTSTSTSFSTSSTSISIPTSTSISTSTSTTPPLITSETLTSLTQPPAPQQTTITQGDFILICDL
ncbi:hypothetical protein EYB26_000814 [Talaromyces marneffei]|uniref:uncharacterized protein n=1 Tax=Talaromyces marneffei TaxID=37727 RepID=UPI0012AA62CC|nr:uncharacterized protein EYB26_000814 [Talaromyces marneffei]QGA13167.1 hypothetical protein EYB26_000814 [Talaromyces marneffei]